MNHVQMLRSAKTRLWDGNGVQPHDKVRFICLAARFAIPEEHLVELERMTREISKRCSPSVSLNGWLKYKGFSIKDLKDKPRLQAHRLAWLDRMIEEAEQNGGYLLNTGPVQGKG